MTWRDLMNAFSVAMNHRGNLENAMFYGDLTRDGGYLDQLGDGSLLANEGRYVDEAGRALQGVDASTGEGALTAYSNLVSSGGKLTGDQQEAFNNLMATEATNSAQKFEEHMRDTDITSSAAQLQALGLSPSGLSGATAGHSGVSAAKVGTGNPALDRYNRKMQIAQSLVGLIGSMSHSGIYGASLIGAKKVAGEIALSTARSGQKITEWRDTIGELKGFKREYNDWRIG